ncbi:MAG: hypothetical protein CMK71_02515 [Pseudomonadaceae bacterium]|nr:hypothetical protein [Pseudomonadaceae bacterium]|tara:strand:- start:1202 stop:1618 length:417 start_codon:yes stop_codon:yes gene_type:complete
MSNKRIRALFESRLATWAAARTPALRIAYQGVKFTPASGETYLQAFLLPATTDSETLEGEHRAYRGVWQVSIVGPSGKGTGAASGIEDELDTLFPNNLRLTNSGFDVYVRSPMSAAAPLEGDVNTTLPVSCAYRADTV